jgi:tape measure domain-containing protein
MEPLILKIHLQDDGTVATEKFVKAVQSAGIEVDSSGKKVDDLNQKMKGIGAAEGPVKTLSSAFSGLKGVLASLGLAIGAHEILEMAESYESLYARVGLATSSQKQQQAVMDDLEGIATRTRSSLSSTANIYLTLSRNADTLGISQQKVSQFTENMNKLLVIAGRDGEEASSGLKQLFRSLAFNELDPRALNSLVSQFPAIAKTISSSMGVSLAQMKQLASQGEITASALINSIGSASGVISSKFERMPVTVGQALTLIGNSLTIAFGKFNEASGLVSSLTSAIGQLPGVIDRNRESLEAFGDKCRSVFKLGADAVKSMTDNVVLLRIAIESIAVYKLQAAFAAIAGSGFITAFAGLAGTFISLASECGLWETTLLFAEAALKKVGVAFTALSTVVKGTVVTAIIVGAVEAIIYFNKHADISTQIWANFYFTILEYWERLKVSIVDAASFIGMRVETTFYMMRDKVMTVLADMEKAANKVLPASMQIKASIDTTSAPNLQKEYDTSYAQRHGASSYYLADLEKQRGQMIQSGYDKASGVGQPLPTPVVAGGNKALDSVGQNVGGSIANVQRLNKELADLTAHLKSIQTESSSSSAINERLQKLTAPASVNGATYNPMSSSTALSQEYAMKQQILSAESAQVAKELELEQAKQVSQKDESKIVELLGKQRDLRAQMNESKVLEQLDLIKQREDDINKLRESRAANAVMTLSTKSEASASTASSHISTMPVDTYAQVLARQQAITEQLKIQQQYEREKLQLALQQAQSSLQSAGSGVNSSDIAARETAQTKLNSLQVQYNALLKVQTDTLLKKSISDTQELGQKFDSLGTYIKQCKDDTQDWSKVISSTLQSMSSSFGSAMADWVTGTKTAKEAFTSFCKSIASTFISTLSEMAFKKALSSLFSPSSGGGATGAGKTLATSVLGSGDTSGATTAATGATSASSGASSSMVSAMSKGFSAVSSGLSTVCSTISNIIGTVISTITTGISTLVTAIFGSSATSSTSSAASSAGTAATIAAAAARMGRVFYPGGVMAFAGGGSFSNSIVSTPTVFAMANGGAGLMGESGPEAVMPLTRDSGGRLGVALTNGAQTPTSSKEAHANADFAVAKAAETFANKFTTHLNSRAGQAMLSRAVKRADGNE